MIKVAKNKEKCAIVNCGNEPFFLGFCYSHLRKVEVKLKKRNGKL